MLALRVKSLAYEKRAKFINDRITSVEKNFAELCDAFATYARKVARLRDAGDDITRNLRNYADKETVNRSLSVNLADVAITLCAVEEYRNIRAQRLEVKIVGELMQYDGICRRVRGEIKRALALHESESNRRRVLDKTKERNPLDRQQISRAESELNVASTDSTRAAEEVEAQTDNFERRKLQSVKRTLKTFIEIELSFHAKALELYTVAYRQIENIDCESDMQVFRERRGNMTDYRDQVGSDELRESTPVENASQSDESETSDESDSSASHQKSDESFYH